MSAIKKPKDKHISDIEIMQGIVGLQIDDKFWISLTKKELVSLLAKVIQKEPDEY